jgi:hypothetical protein
VTQVLITTAAGVPVTVGRAANMDEQGASAHRDSEIPMATAAELLTLSSICPACGYPTIGMGLCAYCRPLMEGPAAATA